MPKADRKTRLVKYDEVLTLGGAEANDIYSVLVEGYNTRSLVHE